MKNFETTKYSLERSFQKEWEYYKKNFFRNFSEKHCVLTLIIMKNTSVTLDKNNSSCFGRKWVYHLQLSSVSLHSWQYKKVHLESANKSACNWACLTIYPYSLGTIYKQQIKNTNLLHLEMLIIKESSNPIKTILVTI